MPESSDNNPFRSPEFPSTKARHKRAKVLLIVLGVVLAPIAALIGGFCCCFGAAMTADSLTGSAESTLAFMVLSFLIGAVVAGGGVIYALVKAGS